MSFLRSLLGGKTEITLEDRAAALAFLVELNALRAVQDDEAARYNNTLAKWGGEMVPGGEGLREVALAARTMAQVNSDVVKRHAAISPIPDVAGACFGAWWNCWQLLDQWSSRAASAYEGMYEGATLPALAIQQLLVEEGKARQKAVKEEARLLKRLGATAEEVRKLVEAGEQLARERHKDDSSERALALKFFKILQLVSARQQLALEEWNDAVAPRASGPLGDEVKYETAPLAVIDEYTAPRLLPIAERRLLTARSICDELAEIRVMEVPELLASAVNAWRTAYQNYLKRCEVAVYNMRALVAGTPASNVDEGQLRQQEGDAVDCGIAAQEAVMTRWRIGFDEVQRIMFNACNQVRLELGKPPLSQNDWSERYARGIAGERIRFYA